MFNDVLNSLLMWALAGGQLIVTLAYLISNSVMPGIEAHTAAGNLDKYEVYIVNTK